jgi:hypothetical protein
MVALSLWLVSTLLQSAQTLLDLARDRHQSRPECLCSAGRDSHLCAPAAAAAFHQNPCSIEQRPGPSPCCRGCICFLLTRTDASSEMANQPAGRSGGRHGSGSQRSLRKLFLMRLATIALLMNEREAKALVDPSVLLPRCWWIGPI